jgi:hypothetical protein
LIFHLAYDTLVFNGLLFIWGAFKKRKYPLGGREALPACRLFGVVVVVVVVVLASLVFFWVPKNTGACPPSSCELKHVRPSDR